MIRKGTTVRLKRGSGVVGPEIRIQTLGDGTPAEWEAAAKIRAIEAWNTRAADNSDAAPSVADLYNELLYAVEKKYPGESRHDTALRHIRDRETISKGESQRAADNGSAVP